MTFSSEEYERLSVNRLSSTSASGFYPMTGYDINAVDPSDCALLVFLLSGFHYKYMDMCCMRVLSIQIEPSVTQETFVFEI
jgi:hypothetical protein